MDVGKAGPDKALYEKFVAQIRDNIVRANGAIVDD